MFFVTVPTLTPYSNTLILSKKLKKKIMDGKEFSKSFMNVWLNIVPQYQYDKYNLGFPFERLYWNRKIMW